MADPEPMLTSPVGFTFIRFAIPSLVGLVAVSTATLVDSMFVGRFVGAHALAAVNLLIPYFTFLFSVCLMLAVGGSVRAGKYLGEGRVSEASAIFGKTLLAVAFFGGCALACALLFEEVLYDVLGVPVQLRETVHEYFPVIAAAMVVQLVAVVAYYFVRLDGSPVLATAALVAGAGTNIALDAILIAGLGGGLRAAACATGVAQALQLAILSRHFRLRRGRLRFSLRQTDGWEVIRAALNGASEFVNEISVGVVILVLNRVLLLRFGVDGVSGFAVVHYALFFSLMLYYGIADGLHAPLSQNFGARHFDRMRKFMMTAACFVGALAALFTGAVALFGEYWTSLVLDDARAAKLAREFLLQVCPIFAISGANILLTVYLTSVHQPLAAGVTALSRTLVLPLAGVAIIVFGGMRWSPLVALPAAEWCAFVLALSLYWKHRPGQDDAASAAVAPVAYGTPSGAP